MSTSTFDTILYEESGPQTEPEYFGDLNLDQVVGAITAGREEYDLKPFFYAPLRSIEAVHYRHAVARDLESAPVIDCVRAFTADVRVTAECLARANKLHYAYQRQRWFLQAVESYCAAVASLHRGLSRLDLGSAGLRAFRDYVREYAGSERFGSLLSASKQLATALNEVRYCVLVRDNGVTVRKYQSEPDYSAEVAATFEKFRQGESKDYRATFSSELEMNHVEAKILEFVGRLFPKIFLRLDEFVRSNQDFFDSVLRRFDREINVYIAYAEYVAGFERAGLSFCYPEISAANKAVFATDTFDAALAAKLAAEGSEIVRNDVELKEGERILIVSGPNQGGKSTFARTFGQLHHLASLGLPVPGRKARLFLFDSLFTHFEREEKVENLRGKLQDELMRIHEILERVTPRSIIVMNEIFSSTTLTDATFLARNVLERIAELDILCVCVTFLAELASLGEKTVSIVSTVLPENPAVRTYKLLRKPADGRSYAVSVAEKYGLDYERLKARMGT